MIRVARSRVCLMAALAVLAVPGCVSIPTDSAVQAGRDVGVQDEPQLNSNLPPGPVDGATREEVVTGFFQAMLAYPRQDALARKFLTPSAARYWDPDRSLVVYDDQEISSAGKAVDVRARRLGTLDKRGAWTSSTRGIDKVDLSVVTKTVKGEWRIANPPDGTYIDADYFERYFDPFSLYFFDPTRTILSPDPIYLLLNDFTATQLVQNLLRGPGAALRGVVSTAAPAGLELTRPVTVSQTSGLAGVALDDTARAMRPGQRRLFSAQLTWTLRQLPEIESISLSVEGRPLAVPGSGDRFDIEEFSGYDPALFGASRQLFGLTRRGLAQVSEDGVSAATGAVTRQRFDPRSAAIDPDGARAALVNQSGTKAVVSPVSESDQESVSGGGPSIWFDRGTDLLRPSFDVHEVLWLVDRTPDGARLLVVTRTRARTVTAPGITGERVLGFSVSRDGTRLAAVVRSAGAARLVVTVVDRDPERPARVRLSTARQVSGLGLTFGGENNIAWLSSTSVAVLASESGGSLQPFDVRIDGSSREPFDGFLPIRPVSIAAAPNPDVPLAVGNRTGQIYLRAPELGWSAYAGAAKVQAPVYPG